MSASCTASSPSGSSRSSGTGVRAPDPVIEDACQFAWSRLVHHGDRVHRDTTLPWLVKTARHEAFKLIRREGRELSLDAALDASGDAPRCARARPDPTSCSPRASGSLRSAVCRIASSACCGYRDLASTTQRWRAERGDTTRTVERQLLRAKQAVRA